MENQIDKNYDERRNKQQHYQNSSSSLCVASVVDYIFT